MKVTECTTLSARPFVNASRWLTSAAVLILCSAFVSCVPENRGPVKIKVLSLNPEEYFGTPIQLKGKLVSVGPAESYLVVEDDTGRVMVGTERIAQKLSCQKQAQVELEGTLLNLKTVAQPYFSMKKLISCHP